MFKFDGGCVRDIMPDVKKIMGDEKAERGINLLEKLINIDLKNERDNFNIKYGEFLNEKSYTNETWNLKEGCHVEELLGKLYQLGGTPSRGWENIHVNQEHIDNNLITLGKYYDAIEFYEWANNPQVVSACKNDNENKRRQAGDAFKISNADAIAYRKCPFYFEHYIRAYQYRNKTSHPEYNITPREKSDHVISMFVVFLDQCIKNEKIIEMAILDYKIDYVKYAKKLREEKPADFDKHFLQLVWMDKNNKDDALKLEECKCAKFIGEAGSGKTTQMRMLYWKEVADVIAGNKKVLPIWINLISFSEGRLNDYMQTVLGDYYMYMDALKKNNRISLYLDGYNETIMVSVADHDAIKRALADDIDKLHAAYPQMSIYMTDRLERSIPYCFGTNVTVCELKGMQRKDMLQYSKKYITGDALKKMEQYLDSEQSDWLDDELMIPAKMNMLMELITAGYGEILDNENVFYEEYLNFILEREETEKRETRTRILRNLLRTMAKELTSPSDEMDEGDIIDLWLPKLKNDSAEADRLLQLAIELPILQKGSSRHKLQFVYDEYFFIFRK